MEKHRKINKITYIFLLIIYLYVQILSKNKIFSFYYSLNYITLKIIGTGD